MSEAQQLTAPKLGLPEKLTNWKSEPSVQQLNEDLQAAVSEQTPHYTRLDKWNDIYFARTFKTNKDYKGSKVEVSLVRKQAEWRIPALSETLLGAEELFDVRPISHEDRARAEQNGLILNNQFNNKIGKVKLIDQMVRDLVRQGTCIMFVGWTYKGEEVTEQEPVYEYTEVQDPAEIEQLQQVYEQAAHLRETAPDTYELEIPEEVKAGFEMSEESGVLVTATQVGVQEFKTEKPIINQPDIEVCNIRNVFVDPTCKGNIDKAQFIVHSYESSLAELKARKIYKNLDKVAIIDHHAEGQLNHDHTGNASYYTFKDRARKKLTVKEYWGNWDINDDNVLVPIVATWIGNVMIRMEENPYPDKKPPFVFMQYIPEDNTHYGIPDAELLGDNQKIVSAIMRGVIDLFGKSANSQTGIAKNMLDATNRRKFYAGENYEFNPQVNPQHNVIHHKFPEVPQSVFNMLNMLNFEAEALSGVKAFSQGISGSSLGETAAGVRGALDAVSKREASILRRISESLSTLGRKIVAMNSSFLSEKEVVRITNSKFVEVRRDDLAGNFDISLSIATPEENKAKADQLAFLMQTLGNNVDFNVTKLMMVEMARLNRMPDLARAIEEYQPEPDPLTEEERTAAIEKVKAETQEILARAQEASTKAVLNDAKVNVEAARAESLQGDADKKAQEFIQNELGVEHGRKLEAESAKVTNQQALMDYKAQLDRDKMADQHNSDIIKKLAESSLQPKV